jgi:rfaE bifunctional protein kinase chain/domain
VSEQAERAAEDAWLESTLARIAGRTVVVCGDLALDAYWTLGDGAAERSLETGLPVQRVTAQRWQLGGAANAAANAAALGAEVRAVGLVGDDAFGRELARSLQRAGIDTAGVAVDPDWHTLVFCKPHLRGVEQARFDFGSAQEPTAAAVRALAAALAHALRGADAVLFVQQAPRGALAPLSATGAALDAALAHAPGVVVLSARDAALRLPHTVIAVNAEEAARRCGPGDAPRGAAGLPAPDPPRDVARLAQALCASTGRAAVVTCGARGLVAADAHGVHTIPGIALPGPVDPVGAGDTVAAALTAALAGGADLRSAARLANLAAAVTVQKPGTTGTAAPHEIRALAQR